MDEITTQNKGRVSRKYKLNYTRLLNYDTKTGFYKSTTKLSFRMYKQQQQKQQQKQQQITTNPWKCEKCENPFATLRELKLHKEKYHAY
jgi:hypothetical protein